MRQMTPGEMIDQIREWDRALAPGSETSVLGDAIYNITSADDPTEAFTWWTGAYGFLADGETPEGWDDRESYVLEAQDDFAGWTK